MFNRRDTALEALAEDMRQKKAAGKMDTKALLAALDADSDFDEEEEEEEDSDDDGDGDGKAVTSKAAMGVLMKIMQQKKAQAAAAKKKKEQAPPQE